MFCSSNSNFDHPLTVCFSIVQCQHLLLCQPLLCPHPCRCFRFICDLSLKCFLSSKSHYKPKPTDCFNDPAFIKLFSQQLCLNAERSNKAKSGSKDIASLQDGLATPPATFTELPDDLDGLNSPVVCESNVVLQVSTTQALLRLRTVQCQLTVNSRYKVRSFG